MTNTVERRLHGDRRKPTRNRNHPDMRALRADAPTGLTMPLSLGGFVLHMILYAVAHKPEIYALAYFAYGQQEPDNDPKN